MAAAHTDVIDQVIPPRSLFVGGTIFKDLAELRNQDPSTIPDILIGDGASLIQDHLLHIISFAKSIREKADKSWPTMLKSNTFFNYVVAYLRGIRRA